MKNPFVISRRLGQRRRRLVLAVALALAGCAAQQVHDDGMRLLAEGQVEPALQSLKKATELEPGNARYRIDYLAQRALLTQSINAKGDAAREAGRLDEAQARYREALRQDSGNERAQRGLQLVQDTRRAAEAMQQAETALKARQNEAALGILRNAAKEMPQNAGVNTMLRSVEERIENERLARERQFDQQAAFKRPVTLTFRDANLKMVFEALSRTSNVNIILDRDVKNDLKTTIYVRDASVEDTIDLILLQNQLEKRVLNNNTIFVYPATAQKQKEYAELKVRSFQLSNVEAAHMEKVIKALLKTKDIVTDARTNTLVMRDTADAIAVAEKVIAANDVPDPEVMLEVEVLEVSADRLSNLGIKWPDTFAVATPGTANTYGDLKNLTRNDLLVTPLSLSLNLLLQDTDTNILASPRIRTRNKEKAKILVGDKVPVITNLLTPQLAGQTSVITGAITYIDVGIKLEVEPQVYVDGDVGIKMNLDVSNIVKTVETASGIAYQIGTRSAQTSLRLKDGETQVLAGLISDLDRTTASKVPGLGQVPVIGRLFSSSNGNGTKSEIVLSITPRIIRPQTAPDLRVGEVWSGTDAAVRDRQLRLNPLGTANTSPNAVQEFGSAAGSGKGALAPVLALPQPHAADGSKTNPAATERATAGPAADAAPAAVSEGSASGYSTAGGAGAAAIGGVPPSVTASAATQAGNLNMPARPVSRAIKGVRGAAPAAAASAPDGAAPSAPSPSPAEKQ